MIEDSARRYAALLVIFCVFFCIFNLAGCIQGYRSTKDPEYLRQFIMAGVMVHIDNNGRYSLQWRCQRSGVSQVDLYDVDADLWERKSGRDLLDVYVNGGVISSYHIPMNEGTLIRLLQDIRKGYRLPKLLNKVKDYFPIRKNLRRQITAAVYGAISGHAVGAWIGKRRLSCDAPRILRLLEKECTWKELEKGIWIARCVTVGAALDRLDTHMSDTDPSSEMLTQINQLKSRFHDLRLRKEKVPYDIKSDDFVALDSLMSFLKEKNLLLIRVKPDRSSWMCW